MNIDLTRDRDAQARPSDDFAGNIPVKLTKEELRKLSDLSPAPKYLSHRCRMDADTDCRVSLPTPLQSRALPVDGGIHRSAAARAAHPDA